VQKLFAGAAAAVVLTAAAPVWATASDGGPPLQAVDPAAQTVTGRAHLIFATGAEPPIIGDVVVIQQGRDLAVVRTRFTTADPMPTGSNAVAPRAPATDKTAKKTEG